MTKQTTKQTKVPGEVLKNEFLAAYQLTISKVAKEIGISSAQLNNIVNNKQKISIPVALRLAKFFGNTAEFWVELQTTHDLAQAARDSKLLSALKDIKKAQKPKGNAQIITFRRGRPANRAKPIRKPAKAKSSGGRKAAGK
ncbi:MAG: HigA family addiction module antidote protein [Spirochaetaceae bacterium]|jgi:addiction module HigA family antidote|nr:HigA family addiction module antidote protein [Spirochaetaceae bacterium]